MKFSLIHPSRQRPNKSFNAIQKWCEFGQEKDFEVIVSLDESDPLLNTYKELYSRNKYVNLIVNPNRSAVDAINNAAKVAKGEVFIVVSDDTDTILRWDAVLRGVIGSRKDFVLKVHDGIQDWLCTMPIMDREYYNRFGYIYYPEFRHMFCDTLLTHQADALKRMIWRNDIKFDHLHYSVRKSEKDDVSSKADNTFQEGKRIYLNLVKKNLLLDKSVDIWALSHHARSHISWLNQALR